MASGTVNRKAMRGSLMLLGKRMMYAIAGARIHFIVHSLQAPSWGRRGFQKISTFFSSGGAAASPSRPAPYLSRSDAAVSTAPRSAILGLSALSE